MDANVKVLMDATGCTETEAQNVLIEAGGNVTAALKLLDAVSKEIMAFQVKFKSAGKESGTGFLAAMFDTKSDSVIYSDMAYPLAAEKEKSLDVNMPPTVFASSLKTVRSGLSDRHAASSSSNAAQIKSRFSSNFIQTVVGLHSRGQSAEASQKFAKIISDVLGEAVTATYAARAHSLNSLASVIGGAKNAAITPQQQAAQLFGSPEAAPANIDLGDLPSASPQEPLPRIVLISEPEIAPFDGKPARALCEGDQVIVKIKDGRESAVYFSELLGGTINGELIPLCVPVVKTNIMSDTFVETFVEFGPGIYGQFFVPPEVKVKTKDGDVEIYDPFQNEESVFSERKFGRQIMYGLCFLFVSIVALIATFLVVS